MKPVRLLLFASLVALLQGCYKEPVANFDYSYTDNAAPADVTFTNQGDIWQLGSEASRGERITAHINRETEGRCPYHRRIPSAYSSYS